MGLRARWSWIGDARAIPFYDRIDLRGISLPRDRAKDGLGLCHAGYRLPVHTEEAVADVEGVTFEAITTTLPSACSMLSVSGSAERRNSRHWQCAVAAACGEGQRR